MKIRHILVDMDPTKDEQPALDRAIHLAKKFGANIELLLVDYNTSLVANNFLNETQLEKAEESYIKARKRWLESYVNRVADENIEVSIDARWHKPLYEGIIKKALECSADLVIKSTHFHPLMNRIFFTPNDWQLLKGCPVPLLLAKSETSSGYSQVLATIDPTQSHSKPQGLDEVILKTTDEWAKKLSLTAHAFHCYEPMGIELWREVGVGVHGIDTETLDYENYTKRLIDHHKEQFEAAIGDHFIDKGNQHLQSGVAHVLIPELVEQNNIDLLVMGTTYRSGLLGSTVEKVLDKVSCDILAVKAPGFDHSV